MKRSLLHGAVFAIAILASGNVYADAIYTLTFSGTAGGTGNKVAYGSDGLDLFGGGNLAGDAYTATITFDPTMLGTDSCGMGSGNYCTWALTSATDFTETITINGQTVTFVATSGTLSYNYYSNTIQFTNVDGTAGGHAFSLQDQVVYGGSGLFTFSATGNVNNPEDLVTVTDGSLQAYSSYLQGNVGTSPSTGFGIDPTTLSVSLGTLVPEPASLTILGSALLGLSLIRRRVRRD